MIGPTPRCNAGLALETRGLRIVHAERGRRRIVIDVARFDVPAQAQAAFVGPPGSGKSGLLRALAALDRPERGSIWWGALCVSALEPAIAARWRRETVGIVGGGFPLLRGVSAYQNVLLPSRLPGLRVSRAVREHARALLDHAGVSAIATLAALPPRDVRRVEIVRALVHAPSIVLADEPTAGLLNGAATEIERTLRVLVAAAGATLVIATRDPAMAARMDLHCELAKLMPRSGEMQPSPLGHS